MIDTNKLVLVEYHGKEWLDHQVIFHDGRHPEFNTRGFYYENRFFRGDQRFENEQIYCAYEITTEPISKGDWVLGFINRVPFLAFMRKWSDINLVVNLEDVHKIVSTTNPGLVDGELPLINPEFVWKELEKMNEQYHLFVGLNKK